MKIYANMHTHSDHSDGGYEPWELARAAKKEGYGAVALTDHDTVTGYRELKEECDKLGLETIIGVEFSPGSKLVPPKPDAKPEDSAFHICGYGFDPEHPGIKSYLEELGAQKREQTRQVHELAVKKGLIRGITWEEILECNSDRTWISGSQFFRAMRAKGIAEEKDRAWLSKEVFRGLRSQVMPCKFRQDFEVIQLIRDAGGVAILAHPHQQLQYVEPLVEMGLGGLEVCHQMLTPEETEQAYKLGLEKGLYISGGSDHHGQCSGYYERYQTPEECPKFVPYLAYGTAEEYFREIKAQKLCR